MAAPAAGAECRWGDKLSCAGTRDALASEMPFSFYSGERSSKLRPSCPATREVRAQLPITVSMSQERFALNVLWVMTVCALSTSRAVAHPGSGIVVAETGRVYFTDTGRGVWRVDDEGKLTLISKSAMVPRDDGVE